MFDQLFAFDVALSKAAISFSSSHPAFERILRVVVTTPEAKGLIPMMSVWYLWLKPTPNLELKRTKLIALLFVTLVAVAIGRLLAATLPFRLRPLADPEVMGVDVAKTGNLIDWSAMPSDHAVTFLALSVGMLFVSRALGLALLCHALFVVCLSRVFTGLHFPSDIIVGGIAGGLLAIGMLPITDRWLSKAPHLVPMIYQTVSRPEIGYPILFVITFEFATMFDGVRMIGSTLFFLMRGG